MNEDLSLQEVRDEIRNLRTLIITFIAGSLIVPVGTLGTDKMVALLAVRRTWLSDNPQGIILLLVWLWAIVPLGRAMRRLSPSNDKSASKLFERLAREYSGAVGNMDDGAKKLARSRIDDVLVVVRDEIAKVNSLIFTGFLLLMCTVVLEIVMALQYL